MTHYYIETDGMVYLVREQGRLVFPQERAQLPCGITVDRAMEINGQEILYCKPLLDRYPRDWYHKDQIPGMEEAVPLVRLAIHTTLPRVVTEAVIAKDDQLLLVKASRGFNADQWTLPGGFVGYGETPEEATEREVREELGVSCHLGRFLGVESFFGEKSYAMWYMFFYEVTIEGEAFRPAPDEIAEIRWFSLVEALTHLEGAKRTKVHALYGQR